MTALDQSVDPDSNSSFEISIQNSGVSDALGVVVTIPLPVNVEFVSADLITEAAAVGRPTGGAAHAGVVTLTFGALPAGLAARVKLVLRPAEAGDIAITVSLAAEGLVAGATQAPGVTVEEIPSITTPRGFCGFGAHFGLPGALAGAGVTRRARHEVSRRSSERAGC